LKANTERETKENHIVNETFIGIPWSYLNETSNELIYSFDGIPDVVKTEDIILPEDFDETGDAIDKV